MTWASQKPQETGAADRPPSPVRRYRCRLETVADVKLEISKCYREARSGLLPVESASKYAHILSLIGRIIDGSDIEARLAAVEAQMAA